jgi:hypothetical protein
LEALLFAVDGFPGISLCAALLGVAIVGAIVGTIVGTIPCGCSLFIAIEFIVIVF